MEKPNKQTDFSLRNIIAGVFRQKRFIFIITPTVIIMAYLYLLLQTPVYDAVVKMHIVGKSQVTADFYYDIGAYSVRQTQMEIVKSNPVLSRAVTALKLDKRPFDYEKNFCHPIKKYLIERGVKKFQEDFDNLIPEKQREFLNKLAMDYLKNSIETILIPGTDLFEIHVKDYSPETAVIMANVVSRSYVIFDLQQQLAELKQKYGEYHPSVMQLRDNIYNMEEKLSGEKLSELEAYGTASVKIIDQATTDNQPLGRSKMQIFLLAIVAGLALGVGIAYAYDLFLDQTFKSPEEIVKYSGLPLLGSVPIKKKKNKILVDTDSFNPSKSDLKYTDFLEDLADQMLIYMRVNNQKTILITSAFPRGGASIISSNVSLCLAQKMGIRTLLIDANLRNPALHKLFKIEEKQGLANLLEEGKLIEYQSMLSDDNIAKFDEIQNTDSTTAQDKKQKRKENDQITKTNRIEKIKLADIIHKYDSKLDILQSGKASMSPLTLLNDSKMDTLFKVFKSSYDAIIIDTTNLKNYKDPGIISSHVDGVALVVNDGKEKRQVVLNSISYIKQKKGNLIGIILNSRRFPIPGIIYKWL